MATQEEHLAVLNMRIDSYLSDIAEMVRYAQEQQNTAKGGDLAYTAGNIAGITASLANVIGVRNHIASEMKGK